MINIIFPSNAIFFPIAGKTLRDTLFKMVTNVNTFLFSHSTFVWTFSVLCVGVCLSHVHFSVQKDCELMHQTDYFPTLT